MIQASHPKSVDITAQQMIFKAELDKVETVWDRHAAMQPQCGFGETGLCCRVCWKGPCRIDPLGNGPKVGICGATADVIVARNLLRSFCVGASAHTEHARHIAHTLYELSQNNAPAYSIKDEAKLIDVAKRLKISTEDKEILDIAKEVAEVSMADFGKHHGEFAWLNAVLNPLRKEKLASLGILPHNLDSVVVNGLSRTHVGSESDPMNLLLAAARLAAADVSVMAMGTELSDVLFGTPMPSLTTANLSVLKKDAVNIALHGHNPLLCEIVCDVAATMQEEAKKLGAKEGINIVGVCCTGNEMMMRHGVPLAANYLSQELTMITGAVEAMVVDTQCIMPAVVETASHYHTQVISTMDDNKIFGATHVSFHPESAVEGAKQIVRLALEAYKRRNPDKVDIPNHVQQAMGGFSYEAITAVLKKLDNENPIKPLIDQIAGGNIQGVVLFGGCSNTKVVHDFNYVTMSRELIKRNVLVLATGCAAGALAKSGMQTSQATLDYAGDGLKAVLAALGDAAGTAGPLPPVLNMGSCVDNTRAVRLANDIAMTLGVDLDMLPVCVSAPELMSEKAQIIGTWAAVIGLPVHIGVVPHVTGSSLVTKFLTQDMEEVLGGKFIVELDPIEAANKLYGEIQKRRQKLGI
ncbi:anaerobic carbon-monoxide dehydrogenase catalytic subunit [Sulfurospirillum sp. T05]|uniref:Carbon monoxide dehydrogenase n=1 Tax=Sulfurospirillum tamanense TaxID=2813362 RepID=A0ABS2WUT9_9BACT|nr:anaerobic carbon-monoxide dehydrogenase catalytic subunit [Sulfurospirillum tamanensis]MBN2965417.1 anaerobic carbon-monoxide dehydrogenase catalytic subunit [Sulfurospirillum tamanensis]